LKATFFKSYYINVLLPIFQHETEYLAILQAVNGSSSEKRLASQFIARFFKYFPKSAEKALDAQFDLCEDDDINVSEMGH
jgi:hypothetical protein